MRKHNFLVGYEGDKQCVYGGETGANWLLPITLLQAKRLSKSIVTPQENKGNRRIIKSVVYKLVKV